MTDAERIDFLLGQVAAIKAFCLAAVIAHPDRELLADAFHLMAEHTDVKMLASPATDELLEGIAEVRSAVERVVGLAEALRARLPDRPR